MRGFPRAPRDWTVLARLRDRAFILAAITIAGVALYLLVEAIRAPSRFGGFGG